MLSFKAQGQGLVGEIRDILPPEKYPVLNISEYGMRANLTKGH